MSTIFPHRVMAAAAMLLVAVGLTWWAVRFGLEGPTTEPQLALVVQNGRQKLHVDNLPALPKDKAIEALTPMPMVGRGGDALRKQLLKAHQDKILPLPPAASLKIRLVNNGDWPVAVRIGDLEPVLSLEIDGVGVLRLSAPESEPPDFLRARSFQLNPGQSHTLEVDRLIDGSPGKLEYIFLTEPGDYLLTARLRFTADGKPLAVAGTPSLLKVGD